MPAGLTYRETIDQVVKAYFDPEAHNLVEIVSGWGVFEWMLFDALDCGYVGVMCNSDSRNGRPRLSWRS